MSADCQTLLDTTALTPQAGAAGIVATTLSFLATTPEAWQERRGEPKLSPAGQFLVKDIVLLGAALLTAAESLQAGPRT